MCKEIKNNTQPRNSDMTNSISRSLEKVSQKEEEKVYFTFEDFKFKPINIEKKFNNHFENENGYIEKTSLLLMQALPMLSNESLKDLVGNKIKQRKLHFHIIKEKSYIIEKILKEYQFSDTRIANIIEGKNLYQIALQAQRSSTRLVVEKIGNIFSVLFLDVNHHIYIDKNITGNEGTLFYEYCPHYKNDDCKFMKDMDECFAFDYLDNNKLMKSYGYEYNPDDEE